MSNLPQNADLYADVRSFKGSEATLSQTQLEQWALLNAIPDMVFVMSVDGRYLDFKLDREHQLIEDLIGRSVLELSFMPIAVAEEILEKLQQTILSGQTQKLEYQIENKVKKKQSMVYYEARFSPIDSEKVLMVVRNVSQQKQLEHDLRGVAEKSQRQATELMLLDRVRRVATQEFELSWVMKRTIDVIADVFDYTLISIYLIEGQELVLQHQRGYTQYIERLPIQKGIMGKVARTGQAILLRSPEDDPDAVWAFDGINSEICVPLLDAGKVIGVLNLESTQTRFFDEADFHLMKALSESLGVAIERARLYQELQYSETRYRELIENASDIIYRTDIYGRFTYANSVVKRLLGYPEESVRGKHYLELIRSDYHERTKAFYMRQVKENMANSYFEFPVLSAEGKEIWLGQNVQLIWQDNMLMGMQAVARDITQRKHMEEALVSQAEELSSVNADLQQFAFVAAHDLQEPLRKIQSFGDRLNRKYKDILDEQGQDYLARMHASATRMRHLIDDLLLFAKTTRRECLLVSLSQIAQEVISDLQDRLDETQGHIEVGYLPTLWANPIQMRQVLQNLLGNALKFHKPGYPPIVKLMSQRMGPEWHIHVQDNGIGFDEQYKDRIFKVFQRLHSHEKYEGTGMGLAIVRKIIESYSGSIDVYSKPGEGSTFILSFPIVFVPSYAPDRNYLTIPDSADKTSGVRS